MKKTVLILIVLFLLTGCVSKHENKKNPPEISSNDEERELLTVEQKEVNNFKLFIESDSIEQEITDIKDMVNAFEITVPESASINRKLIYRNSLLLLKEKEEYIISFSARSSVIKEASLIIQDENGQELFNQMISISAAEGETVIAYTHLSESTVGSIQLVFEVSGAQATLMISEFRIIGSVADVTVSINQVGYLPEGQKIAVFDEYAGDHYKVINEATNEVVFIGKLYNAAFLSETGQVNAHGDFSAVTEEGVYHIQTQMGSISYPFIIKKDVYQGLLQDVLKMITLQRCGHELIAHFSYGLEHWPCHTQLAMIYPTMYEENPSYLDVSGGWHDAGDYGRYVLTTTKTINDLLFAYYVYPDLFTDNFNGQDSGNGIPDVIDEAFIGLTWLEKMQIGWGPVYNAVVTPNFAGEVMPENDNQPLYILPEKNTATASTAASFAMAAIVLADSDPSRADFYLNAAKKSYDYAIQMKGSAGGKNPSEIHAGDYANNSDIDELYYAASALYITTRDSKYLQEIEAFLLSYDSSLAAFNYDNVTGYGSYLLLQDKTFKEERPDLYKIISDNFFSYADSILYMGEYSPTRTAISSYIWGGNKYIANDGILLLLSYQLTGNVRYYDAAQEQLSYLLGKNRLQQSFIIGYGAKFPVNAHHRPSKIKESLLIGALVGGPDGQLEGSLPDALKYYDTYASYTTNEVAIYYNSAVLFLIAGIAKR